MRNRPAHETDLLHILLENSPDRIYFKDLESRFIAGSQGMVNFLGAKSAHDLIGKTDFDFFGREHAQATLEDEKNIIATGEPLIGKLEREDLADGHCRWAKTTKIPMLDDDGRIIGTFGISRDFTNEKELEDRLAAESNLLRCVIDHIPDPIYVKDRRGAYILDNQAHRDFLGCASEKEVLGHDSYHFFPKAVAKAFEKDDARTFRSGRALTNRAEPAIDATGKKVWLLTTKIPVGEDGTHAQLLVCIGRNITEQKLAQEKLIQTNEELTATLDKLKKAHEDLREIQLQLIEAEKLKSVGRLAAGVAHEVKNPLAVVKLGLGLLRQNIPISDEDSTIVLDEMTNAIERADTVVKGLLDFSAPRQMNSSPVDFNQIVRDSLQFVRGELKSHSVKVVTELGEIPLINLDRQKMEQVLINVFTNAAHAMSKKRGTLTVRTRREQLTGVGSNVGDSRNELFHIGDWLLIAEVLDTGPGVPADRIERVFQPFFTTKATGSGTGLGLSVCKTIVDLHGGLIDFKNRPTGGACITLQFPIQ